MRLDRILGLLQFRAMSGECASASAAAFSLIKKHNLTWWDVLEGRALGPKAASRTIMARAADLGIDYLKAAGLACASLQGAQRHARKADHGA